MMAERFDPLPQEIMDAERFIDELLSDAQHPVHNRISQSIGRDDATS